MEGTAGAIFAAGLLEWYSRINQLDDVGSTD
jgi:hypothetical protein